MSYIKPCDAPVSDDYWGHKNRPVPSREPGTDYECAYGTPLAAPGSGRVVMVDNNPSGAEGRRWSLIADDGGQLDLIHNSVIYGAPGDRVEQGEIVALSGGSGFGQNRYYGPHVHVTYRERVGLPYSAASDFELMLAGSSGGNVSPVNTESEDDEMTVSYINVVGGKHQAGTFAVMRSNDGVLFAKRCTTDTHLEGVPVLDDKAVEAWRDVMPFQDL